jgi:hypothetical protein
MNNNLLLKFPIKENNNDFFSLHFLPSSALHPSKKVVKSEYKVRDTNRWEKYIKGKTQNNSHVIAINV